MILGAVGDDFTGSSDLANTLAKGGMRTVLYAGIPADAADPGVEAGVVALKSRTIPADDAVAASLAAVEWLQAQGCRQTLFKYCSTFDSTDAGNIGPVAEALATRVGETAVVVCPAFPAAGRSVYQGHLFVFDRLLSESGMEHHPLTPMRDPDIRRVLARQSAGTVGHVPLPVVARGPEAIAAALADLAGTGHRLIVVDAVSEADLHAIGRAARDRRLLTGGSGIALGLPRNFREDDLLADRSGAWRPEPGPVAALAGSVSAATRAQVAHHAASGHPVREITAAQAVENTVTAGELADWALDAGGVPLICSSAGPEAVEAAQARFGRDLVSSAIESLMAETARRLVAGGTTRLIAAGGETSGSIVTALGITAMEIGPEIDPGIPALRIRGRPLAMALKSGNFGAPDFFAKAARALAAAPEATPEAGV